MLWNFRSRYGNTVERLSFGVVFSCLGWASPCVGDTLELDPDTGGVSVNGSAFVSSASFNGVLIESRTLQGGVREFIVQGDFVANDGDRISATSESASATRLIVGNDAIIQPGAVFDVSAGRSGGGQAGNGGSAGLSGGRGEAGVNGTLPGNGGSPGASGGRGSTGSVGNNGRRGSDGTDGRPISSSGPAGGGGGAGGRGGSNGLDGGDGSTGGLGGAGRAGAGGVTSSNSAPILIGGSGGSGGGGGGQGGQGGSGGRGGTGGRGGDGGDGADGESIIRNGRTVPGGRGGSGGSGGAGESGGAGGIGGQGGRGGRGADGGKGGGALEIRARGILQIDGRILAGGAAGRSGTVGSDGARGSNGQIRTGSSVSDGQDGNLGGAPSDLSGRASGGDGGMGNGSFLTNGRTGDSGVNGQEPITVPISRPGTSAGGGGGGGGGAGGRGGDGGDGGFGGTGGRGGSSGGGAGGTVILDGAVVTGGGEVVLSGGSGSNAGDGGRYFLRSSGTASPTVTDASVSSISGPSLALNPFVAGDTARITNLRGGAETFGIANETSESLRATLLAPVTESSLFGADSVGLAEDGAMLASSFAASDQTALVALLDDASILSGVEQDITGMDLFLLLSPTQSSLALPSLDLGNGFVRLQQGGFAADLLFGGSGFTTISELGANEVFATLVPEDLLTSPIGLELDGNRLSLNERSFTAINGGQIATITAVPEPASTLALAIAGATLCFRRSRRRTERVCIHAQD